MKSGKPHGGAPSRHAPTRKQVEGRFIAHRDGYGFVEPASEQARAGMVGDIFIPPPAVGNAMHGDRVLVEITGQREGGRTEGRIARIATRRHTTVVGTFHYGRNHNYVTPVDEKVRQEIVVPRGMERPPEQRDGGRPAESKHRVHGKEARRTTASGNLEGLIVDVEITQWPTATQNPRGRVIEVLGHEDDFGVDVEMIIRKHHLPHRFPAEALEEAQRYAAVIPAEVIAERRDYRNLPIVTIDGETARDFDDAVLVLRRANGNYELQVHIADVAEYVRRRSALDEEARLRGTSVYFPDRAVPMLPLELSTNLCSLRPQSDRLTLSCVMEIDHQGDVRSYEVHESVIRSAERMTYTDVNALLEGDAVLRRRYAPLAQNFELMRELALALNRKRVRRGAIDFDLPEPVIEFDEAGLMQGVRRSERNIAHRLIEEFMLAANECVAEYLEARVPAIYRIHEKPDAKKIYDFEVLAAAFGYSLGVGALPIQRMQLRGERRERQGSGRNPRAVEVPREVMVTPRMYQKLTEKIAGKPEERILSFLMLRSLKQARYSEENSGHFALAAKHYTHFTSPIRRYPDLIVHRILKQVLRRESEGGRPGVRMNGGPMERAELRAIADETSLAERRAADAERELLEWKQVRFMRERLGEEFAALIVSVTKFGLFVELEEMFIEGLVPLATLMGDRFTYRENTREIIGERTKKKYSLGGRVRVLVDRIDPVERKVQFALVEPQRRR